MNLVTASDRPRRLEPELMDQPGLDPELHRGALEGLRRLNCISRSAGILWRPFAAAARRAAPRMCRVADLACGGGDVTRALARRAARRGISVQIDGFDRSPVAVQYARQRAAAERIEGLEFHEADVLAMPPESQYDIVMCSLFLHHLTEDEALRLLTIMRDMTANCLLVNDLRRTRWGASLVALGCRLLTRSSIVHVDGPLSARAAFSPAELAQLASAAGLHDCRVTSHWPQRMLLAWSRRE